MKGNEATKNFLKKKVKNNPFKTGFTDPRIVKGKRANQKGGVEMAADNRETFIEASIDEELADVLIAISVITKRLARKITENHMSKGEKQCTKTTD
ncbi:MAG: hypothetical protein PHN80_02485 [Hespellia sp.]|nr:hypothetical protein [Hespellia sp.]